MKSIIGRRMRWTMEWKVALAHEDQAEALYRMMQAAGRKMAEQGFGQWDEHYPTLALVRQDIQEKLLFVVMEDAQVLACFTLSTQGIPQYEQVNWLAPNARYCVVHRLCVRPDQQGKGIGRRAMAFVEQVARQRGFEAIRLEAFGENRASLRVYEGSGYSARGEIEAWGMPFICYEKKIV